MKFIPIQRHRLRLVLFRCLAILVGLLPFLALEGGLRLAGWRPRADLSVDPFVEFHDVSPLFVLDPSGQRMEIAKNREPFFRPESFSATKGEKTCRIFALGGSTVQGRPYSIETSFTHWLELSLQAAAPQRDWEVVNGGGVSYASYRLAPIMEEVLTYEPDLIVLYTGHNEFLEDRTYEHIRQVPGLVARVCLPIMKLKSFVFCQQWVGFRRPGPSDATAEERQARMSVEVDALLDYRNGLEDYRRDSAWREGVVQHFEFNVRRMIGMARSAGVPLLLVNPASNLRDCPPFKMEDSPGLSAELRNQVEKLWEEARWLETDQNDRAISLLQEALAINMEHAGLHYHLAHCYLNVGEWELAKSHFVRAKDEDICPLRILSSMQQIVLNVASETKTRCVDAQTRFERSSEGRITGDRWFLDHVHPSIAGHQQIARWIFEDLVAQGMLVPQLGWEADRDQRYREHLQSLDAVYFEHGRQRLEGLRRWTQGRSLKVKEGTVEPGTTESRS